MALQGALDMFPLPDVLRLLAATRQTGDLRVEGNRDRGAVFFHDGGLVDATSEHTTGDPTTEEHLFALLRNEAGAFAFGPTSPLPTPRSTTALEDVLDPALELLQEWRRLDVVVPSLRAHVTMTPSRSSEVTIAAPQWRVLALVGDGTTVHDLADRLRLTEIDVLRLVHDLVELGVITLLLGTAPNGAHQPADHGHQPSRTPGTTSAPPEAAPR